jgi:hypothetical protein
MNRSLSLRTWVVTGVIFGAFLTSTIRGNAQTIVTNDPPLYGPYNAVFLLDGNGLKKPLVKNDSVLRADSPWTLYAWIKPAEALQEPSLIAGVGDPEEEYPRYLALARNRAMLWMGKGNSLAGAASLASAKWHLLAATFDGGEFHLYCDGAQIAHGNLDRGNASPVLEIAPPVPLIALAAFAPPGKSGSWRHFGGSVASLTLLRRALNDDEVKQLFAAPPDFSIVQFEEGSKPWPVQTRAEAGYPAPQDPSIMPKSRAAIEKPAGKITVSVEHTWREDASNQWTLAGGWQMIPAPQVKADAATISVPSYRPRNWMPAVVPGTVLETMIARGIYPDPDYGLNNLAIPESLNKQDYWYRVEFPTPGGARGRRLTLTFEGINYAAAAWLNGRELGSIKGAFIRGVFDVTEFLKPRANVLAVRISPPPHPGIPNEQSMKGGPGENGGMMCLDGPTFVATEGWDWVPAIRDRDSGIWQPVVLSASGAVKIADPQVVTRLPLPDTSRAEVEITVPLENSSNTPVSGMLKASFGETVVSKSVSVPAGKSSIKLAPSEFNQLTVQHPRLWWPNGYGKPELYTLKLSFSENGSESDSKQVRFGIREITYELSLFDSAGQLRRVEYSPTEAQGNSGGPVINVTHNGIREIPAVDPYPADYPPEEKNDWKSWVYSLTAAAEKSAAIRMLNDKATAPYLVIRVNGVRIACRGGNWGMDDSRKRVSRERLEPFFRLHRDAHLNIIRNWVGQNTEEVFYDLADEYGLLVWNDFWESTQDDNLEPEDPALFLANARDTILRFRNHPSIVAWCGRNEGVPQPIVNQGLDELTRSLDGTRYYAPSSNDINLQVSGPYSYHNPALYYTTLNHGFSMETGTPSFSTLESFRAWIPKEDQWPISDDWAYHDWHQSGNGDMGPFMAEMQAEFGAPVSLEDFERKAQMLDYVDHRAMFEGMNAHLWAPNSGRLLWMTQSAWPSNVWQILSHDYDTQSSFYAVKKACEPLHVQLDLSNYNVAVVNTTQDARAGLTVRANVYSLENKSLLKLEEKRDAAANATTDAFALKLEPLLASNDAVLVKLDLLDTNGEVLSDNFYWLGSDSAAYRELNRLPQASFSAKASSSRSNGEAHIRVELKNTGTAVSLQNKLTLVNAADQSRILPAYYSENYVSLLPGESRTIEIDYPANAANSAPELTIRGWNLAHQEISIALP